jgi:hypothetical protein
VWRLDSGAYAELAQLLHDAWRARNAARAAAGLPPLHPLQRLHSNISSIHDIEEVRLRACVRACAHALRRSAASTHRTGMCGRSACVLPGASS